MAGEPKTLCVDCKMEAPPIKGDFTMLSKAGWRCIRSHDRHGHAIADWRCPGCAERYKQNRALRGMSSGFMRAVSAPPPKKSGES